jgi:lipopolysaccharide assembly outer membrane protein LptD (OstA)
LKLLESGVNLKIGRVSSGIGYIYDSRKNPFREKSISQLGLSLGIKISQFWNVSVSQIFNMKKWMGHRNLSRGVFFDYKDECFGFGIGVYKSKYRDKDISPKTGFMITILFKNLANIGGYLKKIYKSNIGMVE